MNNYTFPDGAPDILNKTMTVAEFYDVLTDAWLKAGLTEGEPDARFRRAVFYLCDKAIAERKQ